MPLFYMCQQKNDFGCFLQVDTSLLQHQVMRGLIWMTVIKICSSSGRDNIQTRTLLKSAGFSHIEAQFIRSSLTSSRRVSNSSFEFSS